MRLHKNEDTAGSFFYDDGDTYMLYVHCTDNGDPTGRVYFNSFGYNIRIPDKEYITFLNCNFYYKFRWAEMTTETFDHITWDNCTIAYSEHYGFAIRMDTGSDYNTVKNCTIFEGFSGIYTVS